jgi:hypothetical protein
VPLDGWLPTFRKFAVPSFSGSSSLSLLDCLTVKVNGAIHPAAQFRLLEDLNIQQHHCEDLKGCVKCVTHFFFLYRTAKKEPQLQCVLKLSTPDLDTDVSAL